ncbi:HEPN domain-containing protein [Thermococcus siculi]|uniref:HEPN domain-containing protein n=1 Tax=Thermococcus siculi TaxID=72803 RepID=UPI00202A91EC|nr:HEPN domain-containing protein [Thermococcus siculi]
MWEEIHRELEVAEEELSSAYILFEHGKYRDSISRAYYSMFHAARALILLKGMTPKKHSGQFHSLESTTSRKVLSRSTTGKPSPRRFS